VQSRSACSNTLLPTQVVLPILPGFGGDMRKGAGSADYVTAILHWQNRTINNIIQQVQQAIDDEGRGT
jgi:hypothetical protein